MVFYLKVNRNEKYTFRNFQRWMDVMERMPESKYYILCDNDEVKRELLEQVKFPDGDIRFLESCKTSLELNELVSNITDDRWRNAGYAHLTTFWHAKENRYPYFWNIDADDTCICLSPERVCEMLRMVEEYMEKEEIHIFSLDMWATRTRGQHWSFGITYVNNTINWYEIMKKYCYDEELKSCQIRNVDGYFSCLKMCTDLKIETYYFENLKFIHYADDFFKRPDASGFFYWKDGHLILSILLYCFGIDRLGKLPIGKDIIRFDMNIQDEESKDSLLDYALPKEKQLLKIR